MNTDFEPVIGLEVHVQLNTKTKIFCGCSTKFGLLPNTSICPVCLGYPGVLPVMNEEVVRSAVKVCLMMDFMINTYSRMDRKNYFYPDLPKGYQISQFDNPIGVKGKLSIDTDEGKKEIGITRIHIEEDAGKLIHGDGVSYVDFNRTGVPLLEIVSEPDIRSSKEAYLYLKKLKQILEYTKISDCNMEEGSLRCDANVSIRPKGQAQFGTKTEIKNLNSFKFVQKALDYEIERQMNVLKEGGTISQETRLFDSGTGKTKTMRSKEEAHDYHYFPEPDLLPIMVSEGMIKEATFSLPEKPDDKCARFEKQYGLPAYDASVLTADPSTADYYEECAKFCSNYKMISNWMMGEWLRELNERSVSAVDSPVLAKDLAGLLNMIENGKISGKIAKEIFPEMVKTGKTAEQIVQEKGLTVISDTGAIETMIKEVLGKNEKSVQDYKNGKKGVLGFLIGQVMKASKGKADPKKVNELMEKILS
ncbi:MAG: Asp-tRNA(Asn)/Glu-tRNA(Gln) amidotransferase subunit GatB [Candidatus Aureabacteria bacterium]|nr:Asp-tRNA(Asn)/Glu-tRNA(Gln) amidotransferase subunit GatB [Candidatus Auribacterota bacterium]